MPTVIPPTVGRIVWYYRGAFANRPAEGPLAAIISHVSDDRMVNLSVFDREGRPGPAVGVPLMQEGEPRPVGSYCTWMPYQLGQARNQAGKSALVPNPPQT